MNKTFFAILGVSAMVGLPAHAGSPWDERVELCAEAIGEQGLADVDDYRVKFAGGGGGATKRVTVTLTPVEGGDKMSAQCKIRRGDVVDVKLKA